ncbi:hypothetical protein MMC11_003096 [Xylographa trunciseda]|nr:hypothetical protein [Xylographa trunciseda]
MAIEKEIQSLCVKALEFDSSQCPMPNAVVSIDSGINADCIITFDCNGKFFEVRLSTEAPQGSVEHGYLERLTSALEFKNEEELDSIFEKLSDLLAELCQPWFSRFAGFRRENTHPRPSLDILLYPEVLELELITIDGQPRVNLRNTVEGLRVSAPSSIHKEFFNVDTPTFNISEVEVLETIKKDTVFKASVHGTTVCAKVIGHRFSTQALQREILCLQRIATAESIPQLCVPALLGLILSETNETLVIGFLMEYIDRGPFGPDLFLTNLDSISQMQRDKWGLQLVDCIRRLHDIGIIWGDAKADNIIVDKKGNPWLVDFGGGWTDGWVDSGLADTQAGDLQGLHQILDLLCCSKVKKDRHPLLQSEQED